MSSWMEIKPRMTFHDYEYSTIGRKACEAIHRGRKHSRHRLLCRHGKGGGTMARVVISTVAQAVTASHVFPCLTCLDTAMAPRNASRLGWWKPHMSSHASCVLARGGRGTILGGLSTGDDTDTQRVLARGLAPWHVLLGTRLVPAN